VSGTVVEIAAPSPTETRPGAAATLLGIGTARPERIWPQAELASLQERVWDLDGTARGRWRRIVERSGVVSRAIAADPSDLLHRSTPERMAIFERLAPPLAEAACANALAEAGVAPDRVTDLVVVTCTGLAAPGVGSGLAGGGDLGLPRNVRQLQLAFMGCFGGIAALRTASSLAGADPDAVVLAVCVELCSLHLRDDRDPQNLVASALFADGAAAVVVGGREVVAANRGAAASGSRRASLGRGRTLTLPEGREEMSWRLTEHGFAMTLSREVPRAIEREIGGFLDAAVPRPRVVLAHPGGPGILEAVDRAVACCDLAGRLDPRGGEIAREVLAECGNMSSATILFVLDRALREGLSGPFEAVAFGPGLTIDAIGLGPV